jgi:hypothetical protein
MDLEVWAQTFRVNVRGTMLCCKYAPHMPQPRASITIPIFHRRAWPVFHPSCDNPCSRAYSSLAARRTFRANEQSHSRKEKRTSRIIDHVNLASVKAGLQSIERQV